MLLHRRVAKRTTTQQVIVRSEYSRNSGNV
jgi:hypothetical protein